MTCKIQEEIANTLLTNSWTFAREQGPVFSRKLRFLRNGTISGYSHRNEANWRFTDGCLEFLREDGTVTTRFDEIQKSALESIYLRGQVVGSQPPAFHSLESKQAIGAFNRASDIYPRVAVLVRTHVVNDKLHHLIDCINGSPLFDLYALADETNGKLAIYGCKTLSHSAEMCESLGLNIHPANHANALWLCGDYAMYCAYHTIPDYDYYVMIEFDVHFVRESPLFLEGLINRIIYNRDGAVDFVSTLITGANTKEGFGKDGARLYKDVYWSGLFSVVALSRRAIVHSMSERLAESQNEAIGNILTHCEMFLVSSLMSTGTFICRGLNDLVPGCVSTNKTSYHAGSPKLLAPNFLLGANDYDPDPRIEIIHPVLDANDYLTRMWLQTERTGEFDRFISHLDGLSDKLVRPEIARSFRDRAILAESKKQARPGPML